AGGVEVGSAADVVELTRLAAELESGAARSVAAGCTVYRKRGLGRTVFGEDLDDPARGIPVERREGSPHHLDSLRRAEVEIGGLSLAIGRSGGNAVRVTTKTASAPP